MKNKGLSLLVFLEFVQEYEFVMMLMKKKELKLSAADLQEKKWKLACCM